MTYSGRCRNGYLKAPFKYLYFHLKKQTEIPLGKVCRYQQLRNIIHNSLTSAVTLKEMQPSVIIGTQVYTAVWHGGCW